MSMHWFYIAVLLAGLLALIAILAPRSRRLKAAALCCTAMFLPFSYLAASDLLSRPKPLRIEVAMDHLQHAVVTASVFHEGEAIYLWLQIPGVNQPRAYQLPWDEQTAIDLHEAQRQAELDGTEVEMQLPEGDPLDTDEPMFQAMKVTPPPPKVQ